MSTNISMDIMRAFDSLDYTFDIITFPSIYRKIKSVLPSNKIMFDEFNCETMIGCEVICAAICHKINWDVLRQSVYEYTKMFPDWLKPETLKKIKKTEIKKLLNAYDNPQVNLGERMKTLHEIGEFLLNYDSCFSDIFFNKQGKLKEYEEIVTSLQGIKAFSQDVLQKKIRLLIQTLTDYNGFEQLGNFLKPTIDYHLIRLFIRRGVVQAANQVGRDFMVLDKTRKEQTMAALRKVCEDSLLQICWITDMSVKDINRIEWWIGRSICVKERPDCFLEGENSKWIRGNFDKCPYIDTCQARNNHAEFLILNEPDYKGTSY